MDRRMFVLCISIVLLLASCRSQAPAFLPVTGGKNASAPVQVELARRNVLKYILASSRLASLPQDVDWQMEVSEQSENEYHFRSGDWLIMVWLPSADGGTQRVVILNPIKKACWTGYVTAEGDVVDTHYTR
jgi:hypothetical protein